IMYNLGIIVGAIFLVPYLGVYGLAWGVVLGSFLHMIIQVPIVFKLGYKYRFYINFESKNLKNIVKMMVPRTMTLAITQINLLVITIFASTLASGSLTVFNFANNLQFFPVGIFGISFAIAAFPSLSKMASDRKKLIESLSSTIRKVLFFIVPATVLLITLRAQIVRVVLGTGMFDWQDTILTLDTLGFFALSLFAQALIPLLVRAFYVQHIAKTPFFIGLIGAFINILLVWWFSKFMGVAGLALGFSIANIVNFVLLWMVLHHKLGELDEGRILFSSIKFSLAAIFCGSIVQITKLIIEPLVNMDKFWGVLTQGAIAGILGILGYMLVCYITKSEEFFSIWRLFTRKLPWKKVETGDRGEARGI
ncbi:oligosaccharide flippase family protein, partial [bacterium]|nr:oligosaccharide flippase family protein [bacterium]